MRPKVAYRGNDEDQVIIHALVAEALLSPYMETESLSQSALALSLHYLIKHLLNEMIDNR